MIKSIAYTVADHSMIKVVSGDKEYHVPYPCRMWLRDWIETWVESGNEIAPYAEPAVTRADLRKTINDHSDSLEFGVFTDSHGHSYDTDERSRARMTGVVAEMALGVDVAGLEWTDADNVVRVHDSASFGQLTAEIFAWTQAIHSVRQAKKAELDDLSDAELAAYDVEAGWPE